MSQIFISHSSKDDTAALKVHDWLNQHGWADVFLDRDPVRGLVPGQRWQDELRRAGERCVAVVVLVSPAWAASKWCLAEFLVASQLGKLVFPVLVAPTPVEELPVELVGSLQFGDISDLQREASGFEGLEAGLKLAGLHPSHFPWPPPDEPRRSPFRGLDALEEADAAVYFGRGPLITRGLETLRRMRDGTPERALAIVGMSGVGKSSFLRAGLLARLERDTTNFVVVRPIQPGRGAVTGQNGLIEQIRCSCRRYKASGDETEGILDCAHKHDWAGAVERLKGVAESRLKRVDAARGVGSTRPPTIVISVDQTEALFESQEEETYALLRALPVFAATKDCLIVFTIRSSSYGQLATNQALAGILHTPFNVPPLSRAEYKEVIVGPASLARPPLELAPELVDRLIGEMESSDSLPLLAFALQQIHHLRGTSTAPVGVDTYESLGGLQSIIQRAGQSALVGELVPSIAEVAQALSTIFVPCLVTVDATTRQPQRRTALLSDIPTRVHPLVHRLVDARLLSLDSQESNGNATSIVRVVHESVFRQWPELAAVISREQDALIRLDSVRRSAVEWDRSGRANEWLQHRGERLRDAAALKERQNLTPLLDAQADAYLVACQRLQTTQEAEERAALERERSLIRRSRRIQTVAGALLMAIAALIGLTAVGLYSVGQTQSARASAMLTQLAIDWEGRGLRDRAARLSLVATQNPLPMLRFDASLAEEVLSRAAVGQRTVAILIGHLEALTSAVFSPSGEVILTTSTDGTAATWDSHTARHLRRFVANGGWVLCGAFSPDGRFVATGAQDGNVRVWSVADGKAVATLSSDRLAVASIAFSPDGSRLAAGTESGKVVVWDLATRTPRAYDHHSETVLAVAFSPDGNLLASASGDKMAYLLNAHTGAISSQLEGHTGSISSIAFSRDGQRIVTASGDLSIRVWDVHGRALMSPIRGFTSEVTSAAFSPDGSVIAGSSKDEVVLLGAATGVEVLRLRGHTGVVNSVSFAGDGSSIVTTSNDRTARVWSLQSERFLLYSRPVLRLDYSRDGAVLVLGSADGHAHLHDAKFDKEIGSIGEGTSPIIHVALSPNRERAVLATLSGSLSLWNLKTMKRELLLTTGSTSIRSLSYAPNGDNILSAAADGRVRIWDTRTGAEVSSVHVDDASAAVFSPDGELFATAGGDAVAQLWDFHSRQVVKRLVGHTARVNKIEFSADGAKLVTSSIDNTARIWDAVTGKELRTLTGHELSVATASFAPDSKHVVTASEDRTARIWSVDTGKELVRFSDYDESLRQARFSPDGTSVATVGFKSGVRLRRWAKYVQPTLLQLHGGELQRYACDRYFLNGLAVLDRYELDVVSRLTSFRSNSVCNQRTFGDYFAYAFGSRGGSQK